MQIASLQTQAEVLSSQEQLLVFPHFSNETAFELGCRIVRKAQEEGKAIAVEIIRNGWSIFKVAMPGTRPDNDGWLRRKANTVRQFQRSSLAVKVMMEQKGSTMADRSLSPDDFVFFGGGFPIALEGTGVVGSICVSGLHHTEDHQMIADACAEWLGVSVPSVL